MKCPSKGHSDQISRNNHHTCEKKVVVIVIWKLITKNPERALIKIPTLCWVPTIHILEDHLIHSLAGQTLYLTATWGMDLVELNKLNSSLGVIMAQAMTDYFKF